MTPWLDDGDVRLYHGDVLDVLRQLPDGSVDCVVTSPPYWGLRDYGTGEWDGGDPDCDHKPPPKPGRKFTNGRGEGAERRNICIECDYEGPVESEETERCPKCGSKMWDTGYAGSNLTSWTYRDATVKDGGCPKGCGARRIDKQLGLEPTPDLFVQNMVAVFREVRRVLADHGTCWVNLGDSYNANTGRGFDTNQDGDKNGKKAGAALGQRMLWGKPKDLVGIPWRVAFALQADGWYLRSDIIWAKPNPMPESVTDRPTKAHEYVFLLTKRPRYWFDTEAVREPHADVLGIERFQGKGGVSREEYDANTQGWNGGGLKHKHRNYHPSGRNVRTVWQIATQPYPEAHFATFPEELARRCILAGCPIRVCRVCGKPAERIVDTSYEKSPVHGAGSVVGRHYETGANNFDGAGMPRLNKLTETVGWSDCGHNNWRPGIVLDPFIGSGTVAKVARDHQRHAIGIDLNHTYLELAARRLQQLSLLT